MTLPTAREAANTTETGAAATVWRPQVLAQGFSWRKRALLREFTAAPRIRFVNGKASIPPNADLLLWGSAELPAHVPAGTRVVRIEDGFLRSVGLGADLVRPMSWVIDTQGIYYDARRPSDLETLLQSGTFTQQVLARARALRLEIVRSGLSKYNLPGTAWTRPPTSDRVVLVTGQVESDASIATGTVDVRTNMALLKAVRASRPDAWLVYKPHPDVVAGLRAGGENEDQAHQWADEIIAHGATAQMLPLVDEVHVMTSLTGFEALLRDIPVFCYGQPFYAGWGLTHDRHPHARRTRRLELDALVAATLLQYPVYVSHGTHRRCSPEQALQELMTLRATGSRGKLPWWRRVLRPLLARP
jgi:capsular polysaccharide export protein